MGASVGKKSPIFDKNFRFCETISRPLEKSILESYGRFGGSEITFKVENIKKNKEYHFSHIFPKGRKVSFHQAGEVQNVWNITKKSPVFNKNFRFRETIRELSKNPFGSPMDVLGAQKSLLNIKMHESLS